MAVGVGVEVSDGLVVGVGGGAWMAAVFGFGGVHLAQQGLRINPNLPPQWVGLRFGLAYRGRRIRVSIDPVAVAVSVEQGDKSPLDLTIAGQAVRVAPDRPCRLRYRD